MVEDERLQQLAMAAALEARGYDVLVAGSGRAALAMLSSVEPSVVILDLGLPDMDGLDVRRDLRRWHRGPVIVVTADAIEERMVDALDEGADDYVLKPFSMPVLLARIRVALRHLAAAPVLDEEQLQCGDVVVDVAAHRVAVGGQARDLQAQQFTLLVVLLRNQGRVVTYATLARALWGLEAPKGHMDWLRVAVSKLRKDLGSGPERPRIATEVRVGYRLQAQEG